MALKDLISKLDLSEMRDSIYDSELTKFKGDKLIWLDLGCCKIGSLEIGTFRDFPDLEYLGLYANSIKYISSGVFSNLKKLEYLDLGENKLKDLNADIFTDMSSSLRYLWLYRNDIAESDLSFLKVVNLKELNLNSNSLSEFKFSKIKHMSNLTRFELIHNNLNNIPEYAEVDFPNLEEFIIYKGNGKFGNHIINASAKFVQIPPNNAKKNFFCLVTGSMGSGKSSIITQNHLKKTEFVEPASPKKLFFDHIFGYQYSQDAIVNFYELDGPTITYWKNFIKESDGIIVLFRKETDDEYYEKSKKLFIHIFNNLKPNTPIVICFNQTLEEEPKEHLVKLFPQLNLKSVCLLIVPPGTIKPGIYGGKKIVLNTDFTDKVFIKASELIVQNSNLSV